jgi:hypothetical protein
VKQVEGGGVVGFGCAFLLVGAFTLTAALVDMPLSWMGWTIVVTLPIIAGILTARYGDEFFARLLDRMHWPWWW